MHKDRAKELLLGIQRANREVLQLYRPDAIISEFDRIPDSASYHQVPSRPRSNWALLVNDTSHGAFDVVVRAVLLELIIQFEQRATLKQYTAEILQCFDNSISRILHQVDDSAFQGYSTPNDRLLKDLAICRQHMFPAGAQVVEPNSAFTRTLLYCKDGKQAAAFVRLMYEVGGNSHFYQIHTHLSEMDEFNPTGWDECYSRLAGMMLKHPRVRGMYGGSWFYDPALEMISPRLAYLRQRPQENGAYVLYAKPDLGGDAIAKSDTRRRLFEEGSYKPLVYAVIWPRQAMLKWARTRSDI